FQLRQGAVSGAANGTTLETQEAYTGNSSLVFATQLAPGSQYNMCELQSTSISSTIWTPSDPNEFNPLDMSDCVNFTAPNGTSASIVADNQTPGGGTNTTPASITVTEQTSPASSPQMFTFTLNTVPVTSPVTSFSLSSGHTSSPAP